jgi:protein gp37
MCDWAEGRPDQAEARARLFALIEATPGLDWLLLTKRPGAIKHLVPAAWLETPAANVWYGTSVENQEQADRRIPQLLQVPAVVRFLSCEPLLGPVDLSPWMVHEGQYEKAEWMLAHYGRSQPLDWVISGGESGVGARPLDPDWARSLRDQCQDGGVAFFHKQNGGRIAKSGGRELDGRIWDQFPEVLV